MTTRWKELTSASALPVTVAEAKTALRVVDTQSIATKANRAMGSGNSQLLLIAKVAGAIGNQYSVRALASGNNTALAVTFAGTLLTITLATNGSAASISTVNDVIAAIYACPEAAALFDATGGAGNGTGVMVAISVANLTAGVDSGDEDAYLTFLLTAVTDVVEGYTSQVFIQRTFRAYLDEWPMSNEIDLPVNPVQTVEHVTYLDTNGDEQEFKTYMTLDAQDVLLPARLVLKFGAVYPLLDIQVPNAVYVDFTAGYGAAATNIPAKIKQCILFLTAHWYACREPVINGTAVLSNKIPFTFETVMNSFRLITI